MPTPTIAQRLTAWWRARQRRRTWNALSPEQQMAVWAQCMNDNPKLREMFRQCLRVKGFDQLAKGPR